MMLKVGMKVHTRVGDGCITDIRGGIVTVEVDDPSKNHYARYHAAPVSTIEELNGVSDLERVLEHYASDQDAGHEEPWATSYADLNAPEVYEGSALEVWDKFKAEWGAERYLYSRQLQDANKRIHELEQELLKLREQLKALTSGQTVSVPLSAWNKLCAEAAKARPLAEEEPEAFPARALRFSA